MHDFERNVYCIGGLPFDAIDLSQTMSRLREAKYNNTSCFLTTPNLNFLALAQNDTDFRNSVINSDIVIADGAPIVWIAKLLGIPITERVAGSALFEAFGQETRRKMSVYFFGGPDGAGAEACKRINEKSTGLTCVGYHAPGFGSIDDMSTTIIIDNINMSNADFLVVALGAKKGQAWIMKNLHRIKVPLISHLGAVINFEAKRLKRAPLGLQKVGFEWAWRIKEEPHLWRRYLKDGWFFLRLLATKIFPHAIWLKLNRRRLARLPNQTAVVLDDKGAYAELIVSGVLLDPVSPDVRQLMRQASLQNKNIQVNLNDAEYLGPGILGLLLVLKKQLDNQSLQMKLVGFRSNIRKILDWNGLTYLIG